MSEQFDYDVFVSHSSKDKAIVRPLAERLRADGLRVWFDEWIVKPGDDIYLAVERGLETARTLVLCMSANAFGSDGTQIGGVHVPVSRPDGLLLCPNASASREGAPLRSLAGRQRPRMQPN